MPVKAKRLVMDGQDVLEDTTTADNAALLDELRAIADEQLREEREQVVATLDRINKGLTGWKTSRDDGRPWLWARGIESETDSWRGLQRLGLLFAELEAMRDRIGYLEAFHKPLWCPECNAEGSYPGHLWMKWDCVPHTSWLASQALNIGRDLFGDFIEPAPGAPD